MKNITFVKSLSSFDENYPRYKLGRVLIEKGIPKFQVYNSEKDYKYVDGFNIELDSPFDKIYNYGRICLNKSHERVCVVLSKGFLNNEYKTTLLSRYVYQIVNGPISDEFEVDHNDGNKQNDRISNLLAITKKHNSNKSKYAYYWLHQFNIENKTRYTEYDLLNEKILNQVIEFARPYQDQCRKDWRSRAYYKNIDIYKQRNADYRNKNREDIRKKQREFYDNNKEKRNLYNKKYREENKQSISKQRKESYEHNKDIIKTKTNEYYHENKDIIKEKRKLYRQQNHQFIQARKTLFQRLSILDKKQWTKEIGDKYIDTLNKIFKLYNVTLEDITKGLYTTNFSIATINSLNRLRLLYSEQLGKLDD